MHPQTIWHADADFKLWRAARADAGALEACVEPESVCRAEGDEDDDDEDEEDEEEVEDFAALAPHGLSPSDFYTLVRRPACDTWLACLP